MFSRIIFQAFFVATVQKLAKKKKEILIYTLKNSPKKTLKANNNATRYQSFFFCKLLWCGKFIIKSQISWLASRVYIYREREGCLGCYGRFLFNLHHKIGKKHWGTIVLLLEKSSISVNPNLLPHYYNRFQQVAEMRKDSHNFQFSHLVYSPIWLNVIVGDCQFCYIQNLKKIPRNAYLFTSAFRI
jgi:hypothetical protein